MTFYKQDFEAGTVGSSSATGSGGGGNAAIAVIGTAPTITSTSGEVISGTKSAKCTAAAGAQSGNNLPVTMGTDGGFHFDITIDAGIMASTVDEIIATGRGGGSTRISIAVRGSDKKLTIGDNVGTWASPSPVTAGTYSIDFAISTGSSTATAPYDGKDKWKLTRKSDGAYVFGTSGVIEQLARNTGLGVALTNFNAGAISTTGSPARAPIVDNMYAIDSYAFATLAANVGPTATIMGRQAPQAQGTVVVSGTVTDSDGTVKSAAVQVVSGPNNPTVTNSTTNLNTSTTNVVGTFTGIPGRYVVRIVGTDNSDVAVSAPPTQIVDVYPATDQDVLPYSEVSGTYTRYGTAGDDMTAVTDTDVTTGLQSGLAPAAEKERFQWCAFGPGDVKFFLTHDQSPASPPITVQFTVFKEDGVTQVYQTSVTAPVVTGTETPILVDTAGLALIPNLVDRRALITELSATQ